MTSNPSPNSDHSKSFDNTVKFDLIDELSIQKKDEVETSINTDELANYINLNLFQPEQDLISNNSMKDIILNEQNTLTLSPFYNFEIQNGYDETQCNQISLPSPNVEDFSVNGESTTDNLNRIRLLSDYASSNSDLPNNTIQEFEPNIEPRKIYQSTPSSSSQSSKSALIKLEEKYIRERIFTNNHDPNHPGYDFLYYFETTAAFLSEIEFQPTDHVNLLHIEDIIDAICQGSTFSTKLVLRSDREMAKHSVDEQIDYYCHQASIRLIDRPGSLKDRNQFRNNEAYLALFYLFDILSESSNSEDKKSIKKILMENLEDHFLDGFKKYYRMGYQVQKIWQRFESTSILNLKAINPKWWIRLTKEEIKYMLLALDRITNSKCVSVLRN